MSTPKLENTAATSKPQAIFKDTTSTIWFCYYHENSTKEASVIIHILQRQKETELKSGTFFFP